MLYEKSRRARVVKLRQLIAARTIIFRPPPISQTVFARIIAGVAGSRMSPEHIAFFEQYK